jgi:hypothetical protein
MGLLPAQAAMATNVKVIHPTEFVRARPDGEVDLETSKRMLGELAAAGSRVEQFHVLIDIRNVSGRLTADNLHELASSLPGYGETFLRRTALLCPRERFDSARLFSLLAAGHGFRQLRAFLTYEDAMEWLQSAPEH